MEQLPGNGWTGSSAGFLSTRLGTRAIQHETDTSADAVPRFCQGRFASRPCEDLKGQIYLGRKEFIDKHASRKKILKKSRKHS